MKNILVVAISIGMIAISCTSSHKTGESLILPVEWKFQTGDSADFSKPGFNDESWKTIRVDTFWEAQNYAGYNGYGWYRIRIVIPSSLKKENNVLNALQISLGRIDDMDETWLNGVKIGGMSVWDVDRNYLVPFDMIQWDKENVIAIRVNDTGVNGGMYGNPHLIATIGLADIVKIKTNDTPSAFLHENSKFIKTLIFQVNPLAEKINGRINVTVYEPKSEKIVFQKEGNIEIGKNADTSYSVEVLVKEPNTYKIEFVFASETLGTVSTNSLFSYLTGSHDQEHPVFNLEKLLIPGKEEPFALDNILLGGYLDERMQANLVQRLLNIDETGILECYYNRPGKQTWAGEYTGKYLHAASRVWQSTRDARLKTQMDRIVDILINCQNDDGYLGTYVPDKYWTAWDVWTHKYNMLGLLSYYAVTGHKPALDASVKIGDLICKTFGENDGQRNIINSSSHIGMASTSILEPMTYLYRFTGNKKYLDYCNYILKAYEYENGPKIISTLTTLRKVDKTANAKAYELMSNLTGIVKLYQVTGDKKLLEATVNAWNDISNYKLYITGTASYGEYFRDDFVLPAEPRDQMGEGCVTVAWLQFSQALYYLTGESKYIDEIEKTIYNHLLAAENPETGCVSYYTSLQGKKPYSCSINGNCCLASVPRGIAAIPELAYTRSTENGFCINLYSAGKINQEISTAEGKEIPVECIVDSKFPEEGIATIRINPSVKCNFNLALRVPSWCKNFKASVEGRILEGTPGQYLEIDQSWDKQTNILVSFDMNFQVLDGGKSYPGYIALKEGPQVMAADKSLNHGIEDLNNISLNSPLLAPVSKTLLPAGWVGTQIYKTKAFYNGQPFELILVPFADAGQTGGDVRVWIKKQ